MVLHCAKCGHEIPASQINVTTDVAACPSCGDVFPLASGLKREESTSIALSPPPAAWLTSTPDGFEAGATTRSFIAFFLVPFMLVWSGGSLGGIYGSQIMRGHFDARMSLFGLPFLIGSIVFWSFAAMAIAGRCTVCVKGDDAELFVGVGGLGPRWRFSWKDVGSVSEAATSFRYPGGRGAQLCLEGRKRIGFGSGLSEARRYFLLHALRSKLGVAAMSQPVPYR